MTIKIEIEPDGDAGVRIFFAKDLSVSGSLKAAFPKVRFRPDMRPCWFLPGKTAVKRAAKWAAEATAAREAALAEGRTLRARAAELDTYAVRVTGEMSAILTVPYDNAARDIAKAAGARWTGLQWVVDVRDDAGVDAVIEASRLLRALAEARVAAKKAAALASAVEKASRVRVRIGATKAGDCVKGPRGAIVIGSYGQSWTDGDDQWAYAYGRPATAKEAAAAVQPSRPTDVQDATRAPISTTVVAGSLEVGDVIRHRGEARVVTAIGRVYYADSERHGATLPPHLWDRHVQEATLAVATEDQAAELARSEDAAAERSRTESARSAAVAVVADSGDAPEVGSVPDGDVVWKDGRSGPYGFERKVVLTADGWWHVTYDGSDGALWGQYNLGYNARGSRLRATPELLAALGVGAAMETTP